jgi:hypothetical protein
MKNFILAATITLVILSCDKEGVANNKKFRTVLNNTTWEDSDGQIYVFTTDKLFGYKEDNTNSTCYYFSEGTYPNIESDGCVYSKIENVVIAEDDSTFSFKQVTSKGTPSGGNTGGCEGYTAVLKFILINNSTIEVQSFYDNKFSDSYLINKTTNSVLIDCKDATASGWFI